MRFLKQEEINQRYITNFDIEQFLKKLNPSIFKTSVAGKSVQQKNIYRVDFGVGKFKVLLWSQMHGNETTTTKAIINFLEKLNEEKDSNWLQFFSFTFLPILNPDGAELFTRANANNVDLNRDSVNLSQPESKLLRTVFEEVQPHLALNMHDQRSIFSAGTNKNTATLSFLAPAYNENRDVNETRTFAMQLIASMAQSLKTVAPNIIGRFDDSFNINCIGDQFTHLNVPTILFEAGFSVNDYQRNVAQKLVDISLKNLFNTLISKEFEKYTIADYLEIPENEKNFVDILIENYSTTNPDFKKSHQIPIVFKEKVINGKLVLIPEIDYDSAPNYKFGHLVFNANEEVVNNQNDVERLLEKVIIL